MSFTSVNREQLQQDAIARLIWRAHGEETHEPPKGSGKTLLDQIATAEAAR